MILVHSDYFRHQLFAAKLMASCVQAHPRASKEERRSLCRLIDARKLSPEAAAHAVQNDRLPVRCAAMFFSSQTVLN